MFDNHGGGETMRVVMHVDMDAFFASVAQLDRPELQGRPVLVGGASDRRGVVAAASYEARAFGIRSGMPMARARRLCPHAVVVGGSGARYREVHAQLREIWARYAPVVQVVGIDEAYLDLTGCEGLWGSPESIALAIQAAVRAETGLPCTVGVGSSKVVAKVASRAGKPCGVLRVPDGQEAAWLAPMDVGALPGVGPAAQARLKALGYVRLGQLAQAEGADLHRLLGPWGEELKALAQGLDGRLVHAEREAAKSVGAERTFARDLAEGELLKAHFFDLAQEVAYRLRKHGHLAKRVTVKLRLPDFTTLTRARTLDSATDDEAQIAAAAIALWARHAPSQPLRLVGIQCAQLVGLEQLSWLEEPRRARSRQLNAALDALRQRHGLRAVALGGQMEAQRGRPRRS